MKESVQLAEQVFTNGDQLGTQITKDVFEFTLISMQYNHFESTLSTVVTNTVNNTAVVCTGLSSPATVTLRIAGKLTKKSNDYLQCWAQFRYRRVYMTLNFCISMQMSLLHLKTS